MNCKECGGAFLDSRLRCLRCGAIYGEVSVYEPKEEDKKQDNSQDENQDEFKEINQDDLIFGRAQSNSGGFGDIFSSFGFGGGLFGRMAGGIFNSFGSGLDSLFGMNNSYSDNAYEDEIREQEEIDEIQAKYTVDAFGDLVPKKKCQTVTLLNQVECYDCDGNRTDKKGAKQAEKEEKKKKKEDKR